MSVQLRLADALCALFVRYFQSLAQFHALGIALRRSKPEEFNEHIAPHLPTINVYAVDGERKINKVSLNIRHFYLEESLQLKFSLENNNKSKYVVRIHLPLIL